ncbi:MAG TPA: ABC transporter ATP-binding protein [Candidatus Peribacteraceae bacterium]|nr:ABC transporter ATP-binding protein [Candidatus Peribacteraceae bacterium]
MPLLSLQAVSLRIQDQEILRDVTLNVDEGEVIGLIGPNGSGKTTLFNVISGFIKPTAGSITLHGENITAVSPAKRAQRGLGRVFQNFGIFRDMTLEENVLVALEALPRDSRRALGDLKKVTEETLEMVGLASQGKKKAGALSGGQMRLLEIARTLRSGKELFLLDEPTAGVSPKMTKAVSDLITKLKTARKTVIVIEHDLPFISRICDRVAVMDVGEIVLHGTPETVKQSKKLQDIYFGTDPAQ